MNERAIRAFSDITDLLVTLTKVEPQGLTPRQQKGLEGAEACVMLVSHPGKLDIDELQALAKAGLVFGAVLAGER